MRFVKPEFAHRRYESEHKTGFSLRKFFSRRAKRRLTPLPLLSVSRQGNPFRRQTNSSKKIRYVICAFLSVLLAWLILMLFTPYFRITDVVSSGLRLIKPEEISVNLDEEFLRPESRWPYNNYWLVSENEIADFLHEAYSFNNVTVTKIFPHTLKIEVEEKISSVIFDDGRNYFVLDQNGTAIKLLRDVKQTEFVTTQIVPVRTASSSVGADVPSTSTTKLEHVPNFVAIQNEFGSYPLVYMQTASATAEKQENILKPEVIKGIILAYNTIRQGRVAGIEYFTLDFSPEAGAIIYLQQPWKLYFQPLGDVVTQINRVKQILKTNKPTEYVDARLVDKMYWK